MDSSKISLDRPYLWPPRRRPVGFVFVRHAFISPHGRLLNTADIYVLVFLNKPISGQLLCHDQPITSCDTTETAPKNYFSLF